jgi:tetratricopeptide (TPR) repeat protein
MTIAAKRHPARGRLLLTGVLAFLAGSGCTRSTPDRNPRIAASPDSDPADARRASSAAYREAERSLRAAVAASPASTADRGRLAVFLHANDQLAEAAALYEQLRRDEPSAGRWPYLLARIRQDGGDGEQARMLLEEAAARAPDYAVIDLRRADLFFKLGDPVSAGAAYRAFLVRQPGSAHARLGLARIAMQAQAWREAETQLTAAINADPNLGSSHALLVAVYEALGETARAEAARARAGPTRRYREPDDPWFEALADDCYDVEKLNVLADIAVEAGQAPRGLALLQRALTIETARALPDSAGRGPAIAGLREAVRLEPTLAEAHYALVAELLFAGDLAAALAAAEQAVTVSQRNSGLHRQRGQVLQALRRPAEAEKALRQAVVLDPTDWTNLEAMGNYLWAHDRRDDAAAQYERARVLSRLAVKPRAILAGYYLERGRMTEAEACLREATEIDPALPGLADVRALYHLRSGNARFRNGDLPGAEAAYRQALDVKPDHEESWTGLVALWQRTDRVKEARVRLESLVRENPRATFAYALAARVALQAGDRAAGLDWIERGLAAAAVTGERRQEEALRRLHEQAGGR